MLTLPSGRSAGSLLFIYEEGAQGSNFRVQSNHDSVGFKREVNIFTLSYILISEKNDRLYTDVSVIYLRQFYF